jgi:starch synthase
MDYIRGNSDLIHYLPEFDLTHVNVLEWDHCINSLAVGVKCSDYRFPNYLNEINYSANGLESLFNMVRYKSRGILNGIDTEVWDPAVDKMLEKTIRLKTLRKQQNKGLCTLFNLEPLFSFIGRLLEERGDLLPQASAFFVRKL